MGCPGEARMVISFHPRGFTCRTGYSRSNAGAWLWRVGCLLMQISCNERFLNGSFMDTNNRKPDTKASGLLEVELFGLDVSGC